LCHGVVQLPAAADADSAAPPPLPPASDAETPLGPPAASSPQAPPEPTAPPVSDSKPPKSGKKKSKSKRVQVKEALAEQRGYNPSDLLPPTAKKAKQSETNDAPSAVAVNPQVVADDGQKAADPDTTKGDDEKKRGDKNKSDVTTAKANANLLPPSKKSKSKADDEVGQDQSKAQSTDPPADEAAPMLPPTSSVTGDSPVTATDSPDTKTVEAEVATSSAPESQPTVGDDSTAPPQAPQPIPIPAKQAAAATPSAADELLPPSSGSVSSQEKAVDALLPPGADAPQQEELPGRIDQKRRATEEVGPVKIPTGEGFVSLHDPVKTVTHKKQEKEVARLSREEKAQRRFRRRIIWCVVSGALIWATWYILKKLGPIG